MRRRNWENGQFGGTPLEKGRLNAIEDDIVVALLQLARVPEALFAGAVNTDGSGAPITATVQWPDGTPGNYIGQTSTIPGAIDTYTITYLGAQTVTFTQPAVTRDVDGKLMNRPAITMTEGA